MKTPRFWYKKPGFLSKLLSPFGWAYDLGGRLKRASCSTYKSPVPVISIGNIVSGGAGKTPTALALAKLFQERNYRVHFVTRGYGGRLRGPLKVDSHIHQAQDVGDEALLLSRQAPTWIGRNRALALKKAWEAGPDVILLDDGHQTTSLEKDFSLLVVDLAQGFGNGHVIPAGPLREYVHQGFGRTDAILEVGIGRQTYPFPKPIFQASLVPHPIAPIHRAIAFCGLGFPDKFFHMLKTMKIELIRQIAFPDHHFYSKTDLDKLSSLAEHCRVPLLTTRKDWVKLPPIWRERVLVLDVEMAFREPDQLFDFILKKVPVLQNVCI